MPRCETEELYIREVQMPVNHSYLSSGVSLLDRSSFDIRKSKLSEASGQYLFWKVEDKAIPKTEFLHFTKNNSLVHDYPFILPHYAQ
jgi:hypothetical protein